MHYPKHYPCAMHSDKEFTQQRKLDYIYIIMFWIQPIQTVQYQDSHPVFNVY